MTLRCYATSHQHSKVICAAVAQGSGGSIVPPTSLLDGPAALYGILRGTGDIIRQCEFVHRDYYYLDHGYFLRGHYEGYYKVTKNALQLDRIKKSDGRRWRKLGLDLRPWAREGRHIVVCPPSKAWGDYVGADPVQWTATVTRELSSCTERPIIVKPKDGNSLREVLSDAWCLVTHSSNAAVDAVVSGIPVICTGACGASPVSWGWAEIESPVWKDREKWVESLADGQFTLDELRNGDIEELV